MSGMFDADEWRFECKRDDKAAEEAEAIRKITEEWISWGNKRLINYEGESAANKSYNDQIAAFVDAQIKTEIAKIEGRYNGK